VIGWPRHFAERFWQPSMVVPGANGASTVENYDTGWTWNLTGTDGPRALAWDTLVVIGVNLMAVIVIEYLIRRRSEIPKP
jgi:hypothetical protein